MIGDTLLLPLVWDGPPSRRGPTAREQSADDLRRELLAFSEFGKRTILQELPVEGGAGVPVFVNEFWTAKQRAAHRLHEISYRACFKPALPRFFIERLSLPGDRVYDPFMGRGTTLLEAMLCGRAAAGCDINPLSCMLVEPRLDPPAQAEVAARLEKLPLDREVEVREDLEVFYHPRTLREICALRQHLLERAAEGEMDRVDRWVRMVATNRLTGHSPGFFSVYTLPPNQAVTVASQQRINRQRNQTPPYRDVRALIARKSRQLLSAGLPVADPAAARLREPLLLTGSCDCTPQIADGSVDLIVTSPPFLDVVDYVTDNWLRGWFCGVDTATVPVWQLTRLEQWTAAMGRVLLELRRVLRQGGWIAFEVGDVRGGRVSLEAEIAALGRAAGLEPVLVLINDQRFTKTANCWGVSNATKGTNTNRVVLLRRP